MFGNRVRRRRIRSTYRSQQYKVRMDRMVSTIRIPLHRACRSLLVLRLYRRKVKAAIIRNNLTEWDRPLRIPMTVFITYRRRTGEYIKN